MDNLKVKVKLRKPFSLNSIKRNKVSRINLTKEIK